MGRRLGPRRSPPRGRNEGRGTHSGPGSPAGEEKPSFSARNVASALSERHYFITFRNQVLIMLQQFRWEVA